MTTPSDSVDLAKRRATLLTERLKTLGVPLKRTQALEAVAAAAGFEDWNRYQAHLGNNATTLPIGVLPPRQGERHVVCLRPGEGKTTALAVHCVLQQHRGQTLWFDFAGDGDAFAALPSALQTTMNPVRVRFNVDGNVMDLLPTPPPGRGLFIQMVPHERGTPLGGPLYAQALGAALLQVREQVRAWGADAFNSFGTIVFDEFQRLGGGTHEVDAVVAVVESFVWNHADTLIATQMPLNEKSMRYLSTPFELSLPIKDTGQWENPDLLNHVPHVHSIHAIGLGVPPLDDNALDHFVNVLRVVRREVHIPEAISLGRQDGERAKTVLNLCYEA